MQPQSLFFCIYVQCFGSHFFLFLKTGLVCELLDCNQYCQGFLKLPMGLLLSVSIELLAMF